MRQHLQRLSSWSRAMAGGAALIALIQLGYLLYLMFSTPTAPPPRPRTSQVINPAEAAVSDFGLSMWKLYTGFACLVAAGTAGMNWLASTRWRSAEQYRLLLGVAALNLAFGGLMFNLWVTSIAGCLMGIPTALYATGILIGDDTKKVFRLVETGRTLEEALAGGGKVPGLSGRQAAVADAGDLLLGVATPTPAGSGVRRGPQVSGARAAPQGSGLRLAPQGSGLQTAPKVSGARPAPAASGARPAPRKNPPAR